MIRAVFSASILTSVASIVHTAFIIPPTIVGGMTAEVEAIVSLVVCNLLVVVTFIYRVTHGEGDSLTATEKTKDSSHPLTMVIELGSGDATSLGDTSTNTNTAYSSSGGIVSTVFTGSGLASSGGTSTGFSVSTPSGPAYSNFSVKETHTSKLSMNDGVLSIPEMDQSGSSTVVTQEHLGLPAQSS
ncbi:hypothetical protein ID866_5136 [Astraeus odoratus]|nr:hypothetical protein ID866_5136 [Astraeus odoratus]